MPSFKDNLSATTEALGVKSMGLVWGIASVKWESQEDRDMFLSELIDGKPEAGV